MELIGERRRQPQMKELVVEASRALARLDAERLEELALSCQALNRALPRTNPERRRALEAEARDAAKEMAVFRGILEATEANLSVISRLREFGAGRLEYGGPAGRRWPGTGKRHGDN